MADINAPFCGPFFQEAINAATRAWAVWAAVIGLVIGLLGLAAPSAFAPLS
jgi:hypothetical protein